MYIAANEIDDGVIERLRFTSLPEPSMVSSTNGYVLYSIPLRHIGNEDMNRDVPIISNWILVEYDGEVTLLTNCKAVSGVVPAHYSEDIKVLFRKLEHQGLLSFRDVILLTTAFGVYDVSMINMVCNMCINVGLYFGKYRGSYTVTTATFTSSTREASETIRSVDPWRNAREGVSSGSGRKRRRSRAKPKDNNAYESSGPHSRSINKCDEIVTRTTL